ncbi:hypothetical protein HispidOSU_030868, partial [Sigmodon hispidus]
THPLGQDVDHTALMVFDPLPLQKEVARYGSIVQAFGKLYQIPSSHEPYAE